MICVGSVDDLFLERTLTHVTPTLDMMTTLDPLERPVRFEEDALLTLFGKLGQRYRYIMAEIPPMGVMSMRNVISMPCTFVLVSDGRMSSARDVARWRAWFGEMGEGRRLGEQRKREAMPGVVRIDEVAGEGQQAPLDRGRTCVQLFGHQPGIGAHMRGQQHGLCRGQAEHGMDHVPVRPWFSGRCRGAG